MGRWVSLQMTCLSRGSDGWPGSVLGAPSQLEGVCVVSSSPGWWTVLLLGWGWGGWESPRMWGAERRSRGWETDRLSLQDRVGAGAGGWLSRWVCCWCPRWVVGAVFVCEELMPGLCTGRAPLCVRRRCL